MNALLATHGAELLVVGLMLVVVGGVALRYRVLYLRTREEHRNTCELIDNLSEGIYRSSLEGRQLTANRALVNLNGFDSESEMLSGVMDIAGEWYVEPARRDEFRQILQRDGRVEDFVSEVHRYKTRERIWVSESARIVHHAKTGRPLYYEGSVREVTETIARLRMEEQFRKLTSHLPGGLFQIAWGPSGEPVLLYLSEGFHKLVDLSAEEGKRERGLFQRFVHPEDRDAYVAAFETSRTLLEPLDHEFRIVSATGREKWLRMTAKPEEVDGSVTWYGYASDVSVRKRQGLEIEELAYFDALTKLPNRRLLLLRIADALQNCARTASKSALYFIDLDNFKNLNDTQGHDVGDEYLVDIAARLRGCVGPNDTVARMGGDEFVVILEGIGIDQPTAVSHAIASANEMLVALRAPFERDEVRHASSASIGMVIFDERGSRGEEILKRADIAMYQAKARGRDSAALFEASWMDGEAERLTMLGELRRAIGEGSMELHFQPQVDRVGRVAGAEALLRWRHPSLGLVMPDSFIPLAEQAGLMGQICQFVVAAGVARLAEWSRDARTAQLRLAVNVSVQSFSGTEFTPYVERLVSESGIDASRLTIEFTEHVMAKDQRLVARRMRQLKELGVRFSLDDFGTGYSSLARLKSLPFDEVKIDGGFVNDIESSDGDRALIRTILAMANTLGLEAVAEHVETRNQEAFLHAFGCDLFQGYLYAPALDADDFNAFLSAREDVGGNARHLA